MVSLPVKEAIASLEGAENARIISIAFFCLTVYEWLTTLDDEIKYFWTGPWTASRALFLMNRYLPPLIMMLGLACFFVSNPTHETGFIANIAAIGIIQAILVLRVWYLFSDSKMIRSATMTAFVISIGASLAFACIAARDLHLLPDQVHIAGCRAERPKDFWRMYFPSLILHALLYILTAFRALRNRRILKDAPVLKRLLRDGGFFFFVVFVSVGFTSIGSFLVQFPRINIPIVFSNYLLATTSIAVSRVMLSIHSIAAHLGSDTAWLLNNVELSRVGWRQGATEGEIIVDRWTDDYDDDDLESTYGPAADGRTSALKMSRVGTFNDLPW